MAFRSVSSLVPNAADLLAPINGGRIPLHGGILSRSISESGLSVASWNAMLHLPAMSSAAFLERS